MIEYKLLNEIQLYIENLGGLVEYRRLYTVSDANGNIGYFTQDALLKAIYTDFIPSSIRDFDKGPDLKMYFKDKRRRVKVLYAIFAPESADVDLIVNAASNTPQLPFYKKLKKMVPFTHITAVVSMNDPYQAVEMKLIGLETSGRERA